MNKKYLISLCLIFTLLFGAGALSVKAKTSISSLYDKIAEVAGAIIGDNLSEMMAEEVVVEPINIGGIGDQINYNMQGPITFTDASTTIISVLNPFEATTTLEALVLNQTGVGTSTMQIVCGTSTAAYGEPTGSLINITRPTSTKNVVISGSPEDGDSSIKARIKVGPVEYVLCHATGTSATAGYWASTAINGIIGANNTFDGNAILNWYNWPKE